MCDLRQTADWNGLGALRSGGGLTFIWDLSSHTGWVNSEPATLTLGGQCTNFTLFAPISGADNNMNCHVLSEMKVFGFAATFCSVIWCTSQKNISLALKWD
jgi:hypothetical protein